MIPIFAFLTSTCDATPTTEFNWIQVRTILPNFQKSPFRISNLCYKYVQVIDDSMTEEPDSIVRSVGEGNTRKVLYFNAANSKELLFPCQCWTDYGVQHPRPPRNWTYWGQDIVCINYLKHGWRTSTKWNPSWINPPHRQPMTRPLPFIYLNKIHTQKVESITQCDNIMSLSELTTRNTK